VIEIVLLPPEQLSSAGLPLSFDMTTTMSQQLFQPQRYAISPPRHMTESKQFAPADEQNDSKCEVSAGHLGAAGSFKAFLSLVDRPASHKQIARPISDYR